MGAFAHDLTINSLIFRFTKIVKLCNEQPVLFVNCTYSGEQFRG